MCAYIQQIMLFLMIGCCIILGIGIKSQFQNRKNQFICQIHLRHWGSCLEVHKLEHPMYAKQDIDLDWVRNISKYFHTQDVWHCPSHSNPKELTYAWNAQIVAQYLKPKFAMPGSKILAMDSHPGNGLSLGPSSDIANRHFGGTNLLQNDGAVIYHKAIATENTAQLLEWQIDEDDKIDDP